MAEVRVVIADINRFAVAWKGTHVIVTAAVYLDEELGEVLQADDTLTAQVENLAVYILAGRRQEKCLHGVINVCEIAQLRSTPDLKRFTFQNEPYPEAQKGLASILDTHARSIRVGQTKDTRPNSVHIVVKDVVLLAGHLIDAIYIYRATPMLFIHGQVGGPTIKLAGTGEHDLNGTVVFTTRFQDGKLSSRVDVQISKGIMHRVQVTGLPSQVKQVILTLNQIPHGVLVANISDIKPEFTFAAVHIKQVTAIFRDEVIDQNYFRSLFYQSTSQVRANKAHAASDEHLRTYKQICAVGHDLSSVHKKSAAHRSKIEYWWPLS